MASSFKRTADCNSASIYTYNIGGLGHAPEIFNGQVMLFSKQQNQIPFTSAVQTDGANGLGVRTGHDRLRRLRMSCSMLLSGSTHGSLPSRSSHHGSCSLSVTSAMSSDVRLLGACMLQC